jgi:ankyrin repeat protein
MSSSPIIFAIRNSNLSDLTKALTRGDNVNEIDGNGDIALIVAIRYDNMQAFEKLLAKGADVNQKDRVGNTALIIAVGLKRHVFIKKLLDRGADMDARDPFGHTALENARKAKDGGVVAGMMDEAKKTHNPAPERQEWLRQDAQRHKFKPPRP